jgi:hypothetical protein
MRPLILVLLLIPATPSAQDTAYDPAALMAQAIDHAIKSADSTAIRMRRIRDLGYPLPIPAHLLEKEKYTFKLSTRIMPLPQRPARRDRATIPPPPPAPTENPALTSTIATRLGIATTDPMTEPKACSEVPYPPERGIPGTYPICRYSQTDRIVALSMPVVSGDTARLELWETMNAPRLDDDTVTIISEVTLVGAGSAWRVVSRLTVRTLH